MSDLVDIGIANGVARLRILPRGAHALGPQLRAALMEALDQAEEEDAANVILLTGAEGRLPSGADVSELQNGEQDPYLRDLCGRLDYAEKPVVAALDGMLLGAGAELALAAHYRVATRSTRIAFPEARLGVPPCGGATQRLPRILGAAAALDMLMTGSLGRLVERPFDRLVDDWAYGDLETAATVFAQTLATSDVPPRRLRDATEGHADISAYQAAVKLRRSRNTTPPESAESRIIDLVEAAPLVPFELGIEMEADAFEACRSSARARALLHVTRAEQRVRQKSASTKGPPKALETLCVLGAGSLAAQIVAAALQVGLAVQWGTKDPALREQSLDLFRSFLRHLNDTGALGVRSIAQVTEHLRTGDSAAMTTGADMIIHAARGQGDVPAPLDIIRAVARPGPVKALGMRFATPVFGARLVEMVEGPDITPEHLAWGHTLADRMGKLPLRTVSDRGSVADRLWNACLCAADALVDHGAFPPDVDEACKAWGWTRLPFLSQDRAGLLRGEIQRSGGGTNWGSVLAKAGRTGQKAGKGFYLWDGDAPLPDPGLRASLNEQRAPEDRSADKLMTLLLGAMANEGLRLFEQKTVEHASDIDLVGVLGLDMPRHRGGPMHAVDALGLFVTLKEMERLGHADRDFWEPRPVWRELVKNGLGFDTL